jgi:glycerol uptake facilitator-like aquaporin
MVQRQSRWVFSSTRTPVRTSQRKHGRCTQHSFVGIGATAPFIIGSILKQDGLGSKYTTHQRKMPDLLGPLGIFQIGWGYAIGIILALCVSGATSGGHISPSITIAFTIFRGFPVKKAPG